MIRCHRDEEKTDPAAGHVTSISVLRSYRRLGIAAKLMRQSRMSLFGRPHDFCMPAVNEAEPMNLTERAMVALYNADHITLHVRESNKAAIALYKSTLKFEQTGIEKGYCKFKILPCTKSLSRT